MRSGASMLAPVARGIACAASAGVGYRIQKGGTVSLELARADPADPAKRSQRAGLRRRHFAQCRIVEDDVGWHILRLRQIAANRAQFLEQGILRLVAAARPV